MCRVLIALGAKLVHLDAIGVVAPILLRDVVAVLAVSACERDLRTDIGRLGHGGDPLLSPDVGEDLRLVVCTEPGDSVRVSVLPLSELPVVRVVRVPAQGLGPVDDLAGVFDDQLAGGYGCRRKHAAAVYRAAPHLDSTAGRSAGGLERGHWRHRRLWVH